MNKGGGEKARAEKAAREGGGRGGRGRGRIDVQLNWWNGTTEKDQHPTKLDLGFDPSADFHRYVRRETHTHPFSSKECHKYALLGGRTRANN